MSNILVIATLLSLGIDSSRFADDFESGLNKWTVFGTHIASVRASGDPAHGNVLVLSPNGDGHVLIPNSDRWGSVRIEGDVLFPGEIDSYLGVIYNLQERRDRMDFGLIYIKGDGNYLQANPHRDYNVSRTLYPEFSVPLTRTDGITIGRWQHFRMEVVGSEAHFYVGNVQIPQMTFAFASTAAGALGLQPRSVGGDVWLDNISVTSIEKFSYSGPPKPSIAYSSDSLLTQWTFAGPYPTTRDILAINPESSPGSWRSFPTDARGAIVSGELLEFHGSQTVGYFRTNVSTTKAGDYFLNLSTIDDIALWVNGRFAWFVPRSDAAWYDFWMNDSHKGRRIPVTLREGSNTLVLRVRGGTYASGGFFARIEPATNH